MGNVAADTMMTVAVGATTMSAMDTTKSGDPDETAKVADNNPAETKPAGLGNNRPRGVCNGAK